MNVQNVQKTVVVKKSTSPRLRAYLIVVRVFQFVLFRYCREKVWLFAIRKLGFNFGFGHVMIGGRFSGPSKDPGYEVGAYP